VIPNLPRDASWIVEVQKREAFDESVRFVRGTGNREADERESVDGRTIKN
jgi:hypothetical protein